MLNLEGFNFEHIVSKKGRNLMIGELKAYVEDRIEAKEYDENKDHYICACPYCLTAYKTDPTYNGKPYDKYKLYVKKDYTSGWCFRCDRAWINQSDEIETHLDIPEIEIANQFVLDKLHGSYWNLDLYNNEMDDHDELGLDYLVRKRHRYLRQLEKGLGIKYFNHNPVIPFKYRGELMYYQIKLVFGNHPMKYFSPPIDHKPPYVIEHGDCKKFIICEGTFDAIACLIMAPDYVPFAVLGSSITNYQLSWLRTYVPDKILVYMDKTELSVNVARSIRTHINYADVDIIPSSGQDPEEKLKYLMSEDRPTNWIK